MSLTSYRYSTYPHEFTILETDDSSEFSLRHLLSHEILGVSVAIIGKKTDSTVIIGSDHWDYKGAKEYIRADWYEQIAEPQVPYHLRNKH